MKPTPQQHPAEHPAWTLVMRLYFQARMDAVLAPPGQIAVVTADVGVPCSDLATASGPALVLYLDLVLSHGWAFVREVVVGYGHDAETYVVEYDPPDSGITRPVITRVVEQYLTARTAGTRQAAAVDLPYIIQNNAHTS